MSSAKPRKTRDLRIWFQYFAWRINHFLYVHRPITPLWFEARFGLQYFPWNPLWWKARRWFGQHTGGRSHCCEFTDPNHGALYGHQEGAFMDKFFEVLLERIADEQTEDEA